MMKCCYKISKFKTFKVSQANKIFPDNFSVCEENNEISLIIETESEEQAYSQIQQECDRIFFLTGSQLSPKFQWKTNPNGTTSSQSCISCRLDVVKKLPENINKQLWEPSLAVQLRLWNLSKTINLPVAAKINLLFQIIEISYPETCNVNCYPIYSDPSRRPHSRTEVLLLRNLVSHGNTRTITSPQLKKYCQYLKIPENFHDPTNPDCARILKKGVSLIEKTAREIINKKITLR